MPRLLSSVVALVGGLSLCPALLFAQGVEDYELAPVRYSASQPQDAIVNLDQRLRSGELKLAGDDKAVLQALLKELGIPIESQMLVFSKTSLQRQRISPATPRAIYFSDTCYVGWVPGGLIEIASMDEQLGPVFYSFDPHAMRSTDEARFVRDNDCLRCHGGIFVRGIPSVFARSVFPDAHGEPLLRQGTEVVDHRTPFNLRWGGWYVTGKHGAELHRGNVLASEVKDKLVVDLAKGANLTDLTKFFSTKAYLTNTSDIVALMVFEHQMAMHNALTRASFETRRMLAYQQNLQRELKETVTDDPVYDSVKRVIEGQAQEVVDHLLFKEEAKLPVGGIQGGKEFQTAFLQSARKTSAGASLKELDLKTHLFRHRCSYVIHTLSFKALPAVLKERIYERLVKALQPDEADKRYSYLEPDEKRQIAVILSETDPEFAALYSAK